MSRHNLLLFNKPYQVLCQFSDARNESGCDRLTLADFIDLPAYYPAGRLDFNSEGLLLLTNSGQLQARVTDPARKLGKSYWVQVEGTPDDHDIEQLRHGVHLKDGMTRPAKVQLLTVAPQLWPRNPAVAQHRENNSSWLDITLSEGKNRQIRRMLAAVQHPVLRLVRYAIGPWRLDTLKPGESHLQTIVLPASSQNKMRGRRI